MQVFRLDCVCQYQLDIATNFGERIRIDEFEQIGIYEKRFEALKMDRILINLDRESGAIEYFSTPKLLGYTLNYRNTDLMFDVIVCNDNALVKKIHCNKMFKNGNYTDFYKKWILDKENFKVDSMNTCSTFLDCLANHFREIARKSIPEYVAQLDKSRWQKLSETLSKKLDDVKNFVITNDMIDKKRLRLQSDYEDERRLISE